LPVSFHRGTSVLLLVESRTRGRSAHWDSYALHCGIAACMVGSRTDA
jgi:hypothetical protein